MAPRWPPNDLRSPKITAVYGSGWPTNDPYITPDEPQWPQMTPKWPLDMTPDNPWMTPDNPCAPRLPTYDPKLLFRIKNSQNFLRKKRKNTAGGFATSYNVALVGIILIIGLSNTIQKSLQKTLILPYKTLVICFQFCSKTNVSWGYSVMWRQKSLK